MSSKPFVVLVCTFLIGTGMSCLNAAQEQGSKPLSLLDAAFDQSLRARVTIEYELIGTDLFRNGVWQDPKMDWPMTGLKSGKYRDELLIDRPNQRWQLDRISTDPGGTKSRQRVLSESGFLFAYKATDDTFQVAGVLGSSIKPLPSDYGALAALRSIPLESDSFFLGRPADSVSSNSRIRLTERQQAKYQSLVFTDTEASREIQCDLDKDSTVIKQVRSYEGQTLLSETKIEYVRDDKDHRAKGWTTKAYDSEGRLLYSLKANVVKFLAVQVFTQDDFSQSVVAYKSSFDGAAAIRQRRIDGLLELSSVIESSLGDQWKVRLDLESLSRDGVEPSIMIELPGETVTLQSLLLDHLMEKGLDFYVDGNNLVLTSPRETRENHMHVALFGIKDVALVHRAAFAAKQEVGELEWASHGGIGTFVYGEKGFAVIHTPANRLKIDRFLNRFLHDQGQ